jgi:hypothetical protein
VGTAATVAEDTAGAPQDTRPGATVGGLHAGPPWFWGVALAGLAPHGLALRPTLRFDCAAAGTLALATIGAGITLAWACCVLGPRLLALAAG